MEYHTRAHIVSTYAQLALTPGRAPHFPSRENLILYHCTGYFPWQHMMDGGEIKVARFLFLLILWLMIRWHWRKYCLSNMLRGPGEYFFRTTNRRPNSNLDHIQSCNAFSLQGAAASMPGGTDDTRVRLCASRCTRCRICWPLTRKAQSMSRPSASPRPAFASS